MNPGGSVKDRTAKWMLLDAERRGALVRGTPGRVVEATGGNTGIGLALMGSALGYDTLFTLPDCISKNKQDVMRLLGAEVRLQPLVPFSDARHFYHTAKRLGTELPHSVCLDQFENLANSQSHYESTAPEIWMQTRGAIHGFVCSAGTGGTIGGVSAFLKERDPRIQCYLIDPPGSGAVWV
jgi:cysteine synthase A